MTVCPSCGQENPDGFRFCGSCGADLGETATADAEERKLVSVLFVDLVGHTAASDQADPEDVRARLRPYHQLLKREVERYGGTVEKFVGDAIMAVFGAPVSHEDDAERAIRSALRILDAVEELGLEVRAAIATGEAVVSLSARPEQGEGIVAGDVVNTASRLQNEAPPGALVVGEITFRATRDVIEYEQLEPVQLKGKAELVPLWRALRARGRFGVDAEPAPRTPFVGREHDLALLQNTYERTLREEAIQLATIVGEPGVGKTRLVAEFRSWLDERPERVRWRQGRCLPYGEGITFWALGEIVKAEAGILESDDPEQATAKLEAAVGSADVSASEHEWQAARLGPLVGASGASSGTVEQGESFTAWRQFLEALAAQRPLVVVVEDLHWADAALLGFLEHLVDRSSGVPLLVLCTARPELYERASDWGGGKRNSTTLSLSPLSGEETTRLVSALLERAVLPAETQTALLERSGGNPLYAEEFVRMLMDRGILTKEGGLFSNGEIPVPESVHALIAARLDTLPLDRKALLHDASVVGKVFWPSVVAAVGGVEKSEVEQGLHELVRKELVRSARASSVEGEEEFSFWHLLVRDVAYGQIPRASRAAKHRAAAEWLEEIAGERVADHAELLAEHYRQALELQRAVGSHEPPDELEAKAAAFLVLAGDRAFNLDMEKAERYYGEALELVRRGTHEYARLLDKFAESRPFAGARDLELRREVVRVFQDLNDDRGAAGAMAHLSRVLWSSGQTKEAHDALMEALALVEGKPPSAELCAVYSSLSGQAMTAGRARDSLEWAEKGLPLAENLGLDSLKLRMIQFLGCSRAMLGDIGGLEDLREAVRLGLESGNGPDTALGYTNLAGFTRDADGPVPALEIYDEGIDFAERRGLLGFAGWARGERVWPLFDLGRWDDVMAISEEYEGESQLAVLVRTQRVNVLALRGFVGEAAAMIETLLPRAREIGDAQILLPALAAGALVERLQGRVGDAVELVEEALGATEDSAAFRAWVACEAARVCHAASAQATLSRLVEGIGDLGLTQWNLSLDSARSLLAEVKGRLDEAAEFQLKTARRWHEHGFVFEQAHAQLARGRCLTGLGRAYEAAQPLQEARETFARLGARPLVSEADSWLSHAAAG